MKQLYALVKLAALSCSYLFLTTGKTSAQYCTSGLYSIGCSLDYIVSVTTSNGVTNINNTNTGCSNTNGTGYTYYSSQTHTGQLGSTVNYYILNQGTWTEAYAMWVDFNIDGDFDDAGEQVYSATLGGGGSVNGTFTIPATATPGNSRLRVRCNYGGAPGPCSQLYEGECEDYNFVILSPCAAPTGLTVSAITSQSAVVSWNTVSPSVGYDFAVDQSATAPTATPTATTVTSGNVTGLTPSTNYYLHVRNKCTPTAPSAWVHYAFTTLPPCKPPVGFKTVNLQPTSTGIKWDPWPSATDYDYIVDQSSQDPTSTTGLKNVTNPADNIPSGLNEDTWYYIHIRSNCVGAEQSAWGLDSFLTPIVCRPPVISISHINTDHAVAYWPAVVSATHYEYAITTSPTPPTLGTKYQYTSLQTSALNDGKDYYIHVRSFCSSVGIASASEWGTASFKTFPVAVSTVNNNEAYIEAYPNPVKGTLNINVYGLIDGNASITITDISWRILRQVAVTTAKTVIDMGDLASGLYLLKYTDDHRSEIIRITRE